MKTITAKNITLESFREYGEFVNIMNPSGIAFGDYYRDNITIPPSLVRTGLSPSVCRKPEKMLVQHAEYHNYGSECILPLDDDGVIHLAPASKEPDIQQTEAFILPKGTLIRLNPGVWHAGFMPLNLDTSHVLIILPERTYTTDCVEVWYEQEDWLEIRVP